MTMVDRFLTWLAYDQTMAGVGVVLAAGYIGIGLAMVLTVALVEVLS